ncbi:MAG: PAS domain-containing sensor histidine kinase [Alphaproteobacteria bacterium CG_4_9_14_3_um_filter_47_13]|nr:MAG: PAS domain-containing sensor histidine kinase [Alphaproteobacteria bacterium CG_4_9_14_3_um_filter_47_13]
MTIAAKSNSKKKQSAAANSGMAQDTEARFIADENGCILYTTDAFSRLIYLPNDQIKGMALGDLFEFDDPDDALHVCNMFGRNTHHYIDALYEGSHAIILSGNPQAKKTKFRFDKILTNDGRRFIVGVEETNEKTAKPNSELAGQILQLIDDNYNTESKSKISPTSDEGELRHFLNMSNEVMAISSKDGTFSRVNGSFNQILGFSDDELRAMSFMDLIHQADRPHVLSCLRELMHDDSSDNRIIDFETRLIAKGGKIRCMEIRQKRSGNTIYTVGRDVTAIKEHEAALFKQEQMLGEAQAIGHMGHWRWEVGADDIIWSDEIYRIFGVDKGDFLPTLDHINSMLHRRDIGRLMQAFQRAIIEQNNYEMDFRVIRPDETIRYVRCEGKCEKDHEGGVVALFGIMQDITERTLHERQLKEAKDAAERAYAAKSQFLANMSHELRTPLNAIIGFSEMMQRQLLGPIGTEKYLDYIGGIRESGEHLLDLISDILDMSKIEAGKYELDLEELNAAKVIRLAVHMMEGRAQEAKIKISIDIENEATQLICDRRAFMQILLNLMSNAVKFTNPEGDVRIKCNGLDDYVVIKVHDTGIGIPANMIVCITNPFEQAANHYTREHEGTGLGLAITKELIELHGGSLHIDSIVGKGTCVTIKLPYNAYEHLKRRKASL